MTTRRRRRLADLPRRGRSPTPPPWDGAAVHPRAQPDRSRPTASRPCPGQAGDRRLVATPPGGPPLSVRRSGPAERAPLPAPTPQRTTMRGSAAAPMAPGGSSSATAPAGFGSRPPGRPSLTIWPPGSAAARA